MDKQKNQGEGNKEADRRYREKARDFVEHNDVEQKARDAARDIEDPNQPLSKEEKAGRDRAAEFDPRVHESGKKAH